MQAIIDSIEGGRVGEVEIALVLASNAQAYALTRAKEHHIETAVVRRADFANAVDYENQMIGLLEERAVDLVVLAGFMTILTPHFINHFENRIINVHPSLIPSFCGAGFYGLKVHEAAITKGVKITGATVHFVNAVADDGPIILQKPVAVRDDDTPEVLQRRVMEEAEWIILPEAISLIAQKQLLVEGQRVRRVTN